jgi:DNA modification methylase
MILQGDCLEVLKTLSSESVNCCVTSPPYYGLRDYGTAQWKGGNENCDHSYQKGGRNPETSSKQISNTGTTISQYKSVCLKCGAIRIDDQIGLENTPDEYVTKLVNVFSEVKRILKPEGTLWLNLGDSYNGSGKAGTGDYQERHTEFGKPSTHKERFGKPTHIQGLKPKDLIGIPWMVAFALRADGWYLRQDIIWHKPNPMPESVTDRCTKSHEYIFLLAKSQKYYYDNEAIKEPSVYPDDNRKGRVNEEKAKDFQRDMGNKLIQGDKTYPERNKRDVWTVTTKPYSEAHFATYPPDLIEPMILAGCPKGGIVLDPFFGSGTTGLVAKNFQREFIGIELNPEYIELAKKRIYGELFV